MAFHDILRDKLICHSQFTPQYYKHYLESFQLSVKKNQFDVIVIDAVNAKTHEYQPFYDFATKVRRFESSSD